MSAQVWDELHEPLGLTSGALAGLPAGRVRVSGRAIAGASAVAAAIGLFALARHDSSPGGEPFQVAKVEVLPAPKPAAPDVTASARQTTAPPMASAAQVEATSGVKVTRGSGGAPPNALIIDVPRALAARSSPAQANP